MFVFRRHPNMQLQYLDLSCKQVELISEVVYECRPLQLFVCIRSRLDVAVISGSESSSSSPDQSV